MKQGQYSDDLPLCHLLDDSEALLDDLDSLRATDDLILANDDRLRVPGTVPVVVSIKVVEPSEGSVSTPRIEGEGARPPADHTLSVSNWGGHSSRENQSRQRKSSCDFAEHSCDT
jgi:hypothetical protein